MGALASFSGSPSAVENSSCCSCRAISASSLVSGPRLSVPVMTTSSSPSLSSQSDAGNHARAVFPVGWSRGGSASRLSRRFRGLGGEAWILEEELDGLFEVVVGEAEVLLGLRGRGGRDAGELCHERVIHGCGRWKEGAGGDDEGCGKDVEDSKVYMGLARELGGAILRRLRGSTGRWFGLGRQVMPLLTAIPEVQTAVMAREEGRRGQSRLEKRRRVWWSEGVPASSIIITYYYHHP